VDASIAASLPLVRDSAEDYLNMSIAMMEKNLTMARRNRRTALIMGAVALGWFVLEIVWHFYFPFYSR
jgi:hypothetical protein